MTSDDESERNIKGKSRNAEKYSVCRRNLRSKHEKTEQLHQIMAKKLNSLVKTQPEVALKCRVLKQNTTTMVLI